jgi:proteasome assembly chaperone (PAC2) family protein
MIGLKVHANPRFSSSPRMVAALPDMGNVAGIGLGYLAKKLDAKLYAEIYSYWPPYVTYTDGVIDYSQSSYKFYHVEGSDLLIFTGDFSPTDPRRLYEICYEVLRMAERVGAKTVYSIGAALRQANASSPAETRVYAVASRHEMLADVEKCGAIVLQGEGQVTGFNGLVLGLAKERGLDAICLLGEIDNPNIIQPKTAQLVLQVLLKALGIAPPGMYELDEEEKRKKFMEQQMNYFEKVIERGEPPGIA